MHVLSYAFSILYFHTVTDGCAKKVIMETETSSQEESNRKILT